MTVSFKNALSQESPLQIVGVTSAYAAKMAEEVGFKSLYLSGAGVANISFALPDIGLTTLDNVLEDASRITSAVDLPLLVDIDTGWGDVASSIKALEDVGVAAIHIEDQVEEKRCGHLEGKKLVSTEEMCERIKEAVSARNEMVIIARTDAFANEGMEGAVKRLLAYKQAGADMIFPEAFVNLEDYTTVKEKIGLPILANITEFGKTPLFTRDELKSAGVDMILYPLSASRAMNLTALKVFKEIRNAGTQRNLLEEMQTREELYHFLDYNQEVPK